MSTCIKKVGSPFEKYFFLVWHRKFLRGSAKNVTLL